MIKVINGLKYDTTKATKIAKWENSYGSSDFRWCMESLYVTRSGRYFVCGRGGALSIYSEPCGNNARGEGSKIIVLTEEEALSWCEDREIDSDTISEYFTIEDA